MTKKHDKVLAIRGYMLIRHNTKARNNTLGEVSGKVNEYSVSQNTLTDVLMVSN